MVNKILNAKHWHIFLLTFLLPMVIQYTVMGIIFSQVSAAGAPNMEIIFNYIKILPIIMVVFISALFAWFWSIGVGLQQVIPTPLKLKVSKFKLALLFNTVHILLFMAVFIKAFGSTNINTGLLPIVFIMHLIAMLCMFYSLYFMAKTLKTAELQKEVIFSDFVGEFFMLCFYPIGIWILQPKINKMINKR
ncbi:hypothetical protein VH441_01455 [Psychrobacter sp. HD31]|uniref:hypothetical protein n=1 Tax=Psychrobacter sp. HD31 TaxID=3112003 RepID=UPI003DA21A6B